MKKVYALLMAVCLGVLPLLQSCDDNDGYSLGDFTPPLWATVRTVDNTFYLDCDIWGTLWVTNTNMAGYRPTDGQRVITVFNPLWDNYGGYDHAVKILDLQEVLTKQVEQLTPENEEEYGNDPVWIEKGNITISGGHMNIIFNQNLPSKTKHRISLVRSADDEALDAKDGYIHLELRYNNYDDLTGRRAYGAVSYDLGTLDITAATQGIKLKLNSEVNGEVEVAFDFASSDDEDGTAQQGVDFSKMQLR